MDKKIDAKAFEAFVQKAFKLTAEEVAGLYNEAGELTDFSLIETKDADRIKKLSGDKTSQYNRGLKEGAEKLEKQLKEKYEVEDTDLIGIELFDHILEQKITEVGSNDKDVMKNPEVVKLINQHSKEKKALEKEYQKKLEDKEREINESSLFKEVESSFLAEFDSLSPILPEDPKKVKALKDIIISEAKKFKYQKDKDSFAPLNSDGVILQDEHGYPVTWNNHVKSIAEKYFDFKQSSERKSSGNKSTEKTPSQKVRMPKDQNDYVQMMKDQSLTANERVEIMHLWTKKQ